MASPPAVSLPQPRVDGVLFDVDDTLVDTRHAFAQAIGAAARVWLPDLPEARHGEVLQRWRSDPKGHFRAYTRGEIDFETQRRRRAEDVQSVFGGVPFEDADYAAWVKLFWGTFTTSYVPHADARGAVDALVAAGVRVGALTNAARDLQVAKLARTGFADVPVLVAVDTLGFGKPDPRAFAEACRRLGTEPARTAYVGDELEVDAMGAAGAGLVGVWLDRPEARRGGAWAEDESAAREAGVHVIRSLDGLACALGIAQGAPAGRAGT